MSHATPRTKIASARRKWSAIGACAFVFVAVLVAPSVARGLGRWLVVDESLQHGRAIVVLAGETPFRALEAAALYRAGWADEIWLTQGQARPEPLPGQRMGPEDHEISWRVLAAKGVLPSAIHVQPERNDHTGDEVRSVLRHLRKVGGGRVIFVTSKFHTRRVEMLWRRAGADPADAIVRYPPDDSFDPTAWWRKRGSATSVAREYLNMMGIWLGLSTDWQP